MGQPPVVIAAEVHVEQIDARLDQIFHVFECVRDGAAVFEFLQVRRIHTVSIGLVEREGEVDTVHDRVVRADAAANFLDHIDAKGLPVAVAPQPAAVEGRIRQLLNEVPFMPMQVHAVELHGLRIRRALPNVFDDPLAGVRAQGSARHLRHVEIRIPRGRYRQLERIHQALRVSHAPQARCELDKNARAVGVHILRKIAPAAHNGTRAVDPREIAQLPGLRDRRIDPMRDGNQARGDQPHAALRALRKIGEHFLIGLACLVAHVDVAHRAHDQAVFHRQAVDLDRREKMVVWIEPARHAALCDPFFVLKPVAEGVHQLLYFWICLHRIPPVFIGCSGRKRPLLILCPAISV